MHSQTGKPTVFGAASEHFAAIGFNLNRSYGLMAQDQISQ
jgi:hypothetical protein